MLPFPSLSYPVWHQSDEVFEEACRADDSFVTQVLQRHLNSERHKWVNVNLTCVCVCAYRYWYTRTKSVTLSNCFSKERSLSYNRQTQPKIPSRKGQYWPHNNNFLEQENHCYLIQWVKKPSVFVDTYKRQILPLLCLPLVKVTGDSGENCSQKETYHSV